MTASLCLCAGDIFCTRNPMWLGRAINAVQRFHAIDNESAYSHAGIIVGPSGRTFESLWTIRYAELANYTGKGVLIGRHVSMSPSIAAQGLRQLSAYEGRIYPFHRLIFHLIPPVAKYVSSGKFLVCSELVARFLWLCGLKSYWKGVNPDHIADWIRKYRDFEIVFEGKFDPKDVVQIP